MTRNVTGMAMALALVVTTATARAGDATDTPGVFVDVTRKPLGGHYFSQMIYAPNVNAVVTWGTRVHGKPMQAHETQMFLLDQNKWIDAWPKGKEEAWAGKYKRWPGWGMANPLGHFYTRDDIQMPRPNTAFYQVCWDDHNKRLVYYLGSMTFTFDPVTRMWKQVYDRSVKAQPPALLLWSSLCYDPVNKQVILFGGGGVDAVDGRPHTWALDVTTDTWKKLDLEVEPPARCNSRMVYDKKNKVIVLFGGDGQDRALADTWVFDVTKQQWQERKPAQSPWPRSCHAMTYLEKSGLVLLAGGKPVIEYRRARATAQQTWVYDAAKNTWTPLAVETPRADWMTMDGIAGTDEAVLVTVGKWSHGGKTYRFRYDPSIPAAKTKGVPPGTVAHKSGNTPEKFARAWVDENDTQAKRLESLPVNQWVEVKPPLTVNGRTWGTSLFDTERNLAMKWGGGHSGYQGTDMAFYSVSLNRWAIDRRPAFTPEPFGRMATRPAGRTFFNQPWARHMRHTCAYDSVRKVGVFTDAGGSDWYERDLGKSVKHTWVYNCEKREWYEHLVPQPFPGGGAVSPIAIPTPNGVVVYHHGKMFRFTGQADQPESWGWESIEIQGAARPNQREHMTIVYDQKRDRLIFLSGDKEGPALWFFSMKDRTWVKNPKPAAGGVTTREAVYVPDQDAVLAYGPAKKGDSVWTRAYLCAENRWVPLTVKTPQYLVHEVGMEYDPKNQVAVLLWPPAFEQGIRPHLLRLDVSKLKD